MNITITIPIPNRGLSPNGRAHWRRKSPLVRNARSIAHLLAQDAARKIHHSARIPWERATYDIEARFKTARFWDQDNLIAALKPTLDGIADAGVVSNDRNLTLGSYTAIKSKENPGVTITIKPL